MSVSLNENTYNKLKKDIMTFKLIPGDVISAQKVAMRYDVSRTPAREAIVKLEKDGLLKIYPKSGTYVAKINMARANQEWFVRMNLEIGMVNQFIRNCSDDVIEKMKEKNEKLEHFSDIQEDISRIEIDNGFHDLIYECSHEYLSKEIINTQMTHYNRIRYLADLNEKISHKTVLEHRALIKAAEQKDTKTFETVIKKHIRRIAGDQEKLIKIYPEFFEI